MNYPNMVDARKRGKEEVKYIYEIVIIMKYLKEKNILLKLMVVK